MTRILLVSTFGMLLGACGGPSAPSTEGAPAPATEAPSGPVEAAAPDTPMPDARVAALNLRCGNENFRVAFEDTRAVLVNDDGSNTELAKLEPGPTSEPGITTYTDGKLTFAKSGGGDSPTVVRFAHGRMALQDCAIAVN